MKHNTVAVLLVLVLGAMCAGSVVEALPASSVADPVEAVPREMPDWPMPDKPIPHHEPGRPSRAASYKTSVAYENELGVPATMELSGINAMVADDVDPLAGNYTMVPLDKIMYASTDSGILGVETMGYVSPTLDVVSPWSGDSTDGAVASSYDVAAGDLNGDGQDEQVVVWLDDDDEIVISTGEMPGSLGRTTSAPAAVVHDSGAADVLVRGYDEALWHLHKPEGVDWHALVLPDDWNNDAGGRLLSAPTVAPLDGNAFVAVAVMSDNLIWHRRWDGSSWEEWLRAEPEGARAPLEAWYGPTPELPAPAVVARGSGLDLFRIGPDNTLHWMHSDDGVAWGAWVSLGGMLASGPGAVSLANDRLMVVARGVDEALWSLEFDGSAWREWRRVELDDAIVGATIASAPTAVASATGVDVYVQASDGSLWRVGHEVSTSWGAWEPLGTGIVSSVAAASDAWALVAQDEDGDLVYSDDGIDWTAAGGLVPCCEITETSFKAIRSSLLPYRDYSIDVDTGRFAGSGSELISVGYHTAPGELELAVLRRGAGFAVDVGATAVATVTVPHLVDRFRLTSSNIASSDGRDNIAVAYVSGHDYGVDVFELQQSSDPGTDSELTLVSTAEAETYEAFAGTLEMVSADLNGDGRDELAVLSLSYRDDWWWFKHCKTWIYHARLTLFEAASGQLGRLTFQFAGGGGGWLYQSADVRPEGNAVHAHAFSLASGDTDGDGRDELIRTWPAGFAEGTWDCSGQYTQEISKAKRLWRELEIIDFPDNASGNPALDADADGEVDEALRPFRKGFGVTTPSSAGDRVVAGDIDADLRSEILWRSNNTARIVEYDDEGVYIVRDTGLTSSAFFAPMAVMDTGDFTRDGVRVGSPSYRVQTRVDTLLARINAPPKHRDLIRLPDGTYEKLESPEGDCNPSPDSPDCTHAKYASLDFESSEQTIETTNAYEMSAGMSAEVCAGGGVPGVATAKGCVSSSIDTTYGQNFEKSHGTLEEMSFKRKVIAASDDKIVYFGTPYGVWEYPVLDGGSSSEQEDFLTVTLPLITRTQYPDTAGGYYAGMCDETWYRARHQPGNVWSYDAIGDLRFADLDPSRVIAFDSIEGDWAEGTITSLEQMTDYKSLELTHSLSSELGVSTEVEASVGVVDVEANFSAYVRGEYSESGKAADRVTNTAETEYSYFLAPQPDHLKYLTRVLLYRATNDAFVIDYQTEPGRGAGWQLYDKPDPAFILPWYGFPHPPDDPVIPPCGEQKKHFSPDIAVEPASANPGEEVQITASLRNFSYVRPGAVKVHFFKGQPEPDNSNYIGQALTPAGEELARESGPLQASITWIASGVGHQKIYAVIDPDNAIDEAHDVGHLIDNNVGYGILAMAGGGLADMADPLSKPYDVISYTLGHEALSMASADGVALSSASATDADGPHLSLFVPRAGLSAVARFEVAGERTGYQHKHVGFRVTAYQGSKYKLWTEPIEGFDLRPDAQDPPAVVSIQYDNGDLGGMLPTQLRLYRETGGEWERAVCGEHETHHFLRDRLIAVPICRTGVFALSDGSSGPVPPPANRSPHTPSGPTPADGAVDVGWQPALSWSGGDPDGDSVLYSVTWSTAPTDTLGIWCEISDDTSCRVPHQLSPGTKYYWSVLATDPSGLSAKSAIWSFETAVTVPQPADTYFASAGRADKVAAIHAQNLDPDYEAEIEARFYHQDGRPPVRITRSGISPLSKADYGLGEIGELEEGEYAVTLRADREIASAELHYWPGGPAAAVGQLEPATEVVVPLVVRDWEDQYSTVAIQNTDEFSSTAVSVEIYAQGAASASWTHSYELLPGTSLTLELEDDTTFASLVRPFLGSMRIVSESTAPVTAQAFVQQASSPEAVYAYEGLPAGLAASTLYVPLFRSNWFGTTGINVANPNPDGVEVSVAFRGTEQADNGCSGDEITQGPVTVPGYSSVNFWQGPGGGSGLPDSCFGSAVISSSGGDVLAMVNDSVLDGTAVIVSAAYVAVPRSRTGTTLAVPFVPDDAGVERWNTGLQLMNPSTSDPATIRVTFVDAAGSPVDHKPQFERVISPGASTGMVTVLGNLGNVFLDQAGSAVVKSDLPVVALANVFALPFGYRDAATYNAIAGGTGSAIDACHLYGSLHGESGAAEVVGINPKAGVAAIVGNGVQGAHISGTAVDPGSLELFVVSVELDGEQEATLRRLDPGTGRYETIGALGVGGGRGLSFRPSDASLWSWWPGHGLVTVGVAGGQRTLVVASDLDVSDVAWSPDGAVLYIAGGTNLWMYEPQSDEITPAAHALPAAVGGMATRSDGRLHLIPATYTEGDTAAEFLVFDPTTGVVVGRTPVPKLPVAADPSAGALEAAVDSLTWMPSCGNPAAGGAAELIDQIEIEPQEPCALEDVRVRVRASHPMGGDNDVVVEVNGQQGSEQVLQFDGLPGDRLVSVSASTDDGYSDHETVVARVRDCPSIPHVDLAAERNPFHAHMVDFLVRNADSLAPDGASYGWQFGDGNETTSEFPFISHSYSDVLDPAVISTAFTVTATVKVSDTLEVRGSTTVSVWNDYAAVRSRGVVRLPVEPDLRMHAVDGVLVGTAAMHNPEPTGVVLDRRRLELQYCDSAIEPEPAEWQDIDVSIPAGSDWSTEIRVDMATVSQDVCDVVARFEGHAGPLVDVVADAYLEVKRDEGALTAESDEGILAMLTDVAYRDLVPDTTVITDEELRQLVGEGRVQVPEDVLQTSRGGSSISRLPVTSPSDTAPEPSADCDENPIGCLCDPGQPPPDGWEGRVTCQVASHLDDMGSRVLEYDRFPPHIPNALKGDIVLVSACGFVGEMLKVLNQTYTHTGMMTKNYTEIVHSTSTDKRAADEDHLNYLPTPHIAPDVLRHGWPGVIRSDIGTAFNTMYLADPGGTSYWMADFSPTPAGCPGQIAPPLVVKPPPALARTVRPLLHKAADLATKLSTPVEEWDRHGRTGTGHYRFYAYTDASIASNPRFDHPSGEPATVCSTFVWHVLTSVGAPLEGDTLEPEDVRRGGQLDELTRDGLYFYPIEGRYNAALLMWNSAHETVMGTSLFDPLFDVIADGIANQLVNCFATDDCDWQDTLHQDWKQGPPGRTASPDDILKWDAPPSGVYGHTERLEFRSGGWKLVHKWVPSVGTGSVTGHTVNDDGSPVSGATVVLSAAGGIETESDADGGFTIDAVPAGLYAIEAWKQLPDKLLSTRNQSIDVAADDTASIELVLLPPESLYRHISFGPGLDLPPGPAAFSYREFQYDAGCYGGRFNYAAGDLGQGTGEVACRVDPYTTLVDDFTWAYCLGDSCLRMGGECRLDADASEPRTVHGFIHIVMDSPGTDGGTNVQTLNFSILPGQSVALNAHVRYKDWCWPPMSIFPVYEWDLADVGLIATNGVQGEAPP